MSMIKVRASRAIPEDERQMLIAAFDAEGEVEEERSLGFAPDPDWITFIAVIKDVGAIAGAGASVVGLAKELLAWRRRRHERGEEAAVTIEAPGRQKLELESATDDEVRAWFVPGARSSGA